MKSKRDRRDPSPVKAAVCSEQVLDAPHLRVPPISIVINAPGRSGGPLGDQYTHLHVIGGNYDIAQKLRLLADVISTTEEPGGTVVGGDIILLVRKDRSKIPF